MEHLRHTKAKERRGETARDEVEGRGSRRRSAKWAEAQPNLPLKRTDLRAFLFDRL